MDDEPDVSCRFMPGCTGDRDHIVPQEIVYTLSLVVVRPA
jgi:hypothetical protein